MRKIAIIGSGQAGLVCAHGLLKAGHSVRLFSDRTPQAWLDSSRPTGTAGRFATALRFEHELGLDHWADEAPAVGGAHMTLCPTVGNRLLTMAGRLGQPGVAIDLRLQSHRWMLDLEARGGAVEIGEVSVAKLDEIAHEHDLTLVATGKGGLASLFERDAVRCTYDRPQRNLAMLCVKGPSLEVPGVPYLPFKFNVIEPAGEAFWVPYHHKDAGPSWNMLFEAKPGGPMDRFDGAKSAKQVLDIARGVLRDLVPWDSPWFEDAEVSDENGWLVGSVNPVVRKPVGRLPSGRSVMALGDTAMAIDPVAGQGANNGNHMARCVVEGVAAREDRPLDDAWMTETFDRFWNERGKHSDALTSFLLEPASAMAKVFMVAQYGSDGRAERTDGQQALANAFAENFEFPGRYTGTFRDGARLRAFIREKTGSLAAAVARNVPAIVRGQIRQRLGKDPGHPLAPSAAAG